MADHHRKRRKEKTQYLSLMQRLTARWVPVYLVVDISIIAVLYVFFPLARLVLVEVPLWYWPVVYIPFALLTFFEKSDVPLTFNEKMKMKRLLGYLTVLTVGLLLMRKLLVATLPLTYLVQFDGNWATFVISVLGSLHAGLSEEPFKAFWTNWIGSVLQRRFHLRIGRHPLTYQLNRIGKRDVVWVAGIISTVAWVYLHVLLAGYRLPDFILAIFAGIVLFFALMRTRDLRLIIVAHVLYDLFVPSVAAIRI